MTGRTSWWARDAAAHDRELVVELGEEHGPSGPYVMTVMGDLAQQQRNDGRVKTGFRSLARKAFCTPDEARAIVEMAARIGALDDYEPDPDGRRFVCRVSGWLADQARGREALKKADQRAAATAALSTQDGDMSPAEGTCPQNVPSRARPRRPDQTIGSTSSSSELDGARAENELFAYWQERCGHQQAKFTRDRRAKVRARLREGYSVDQIRQAIDGAARAAFTNDAGKTFDDLELICRNGSKLEDFMGRAAPAAGNGAGGGWSAASFVAAINGESGAAA